MCELERNKTHLPAATTTKTAATRITTANTVAMTIIVEARKLEHHYPHALKVKYKGS